MERKAESTFWMRYKYLLWDAWMNKEGEKFSLLQKIAVSTVGVIFIYAEPDSTFLDKYYKVFDKKK